MLLIYMDSGASSPEKGVCHRRVAFDITYQHKTTFSLEMTLHLHVDNTFNKDSKIKLAEEFLFRRLHLFKCCQMLFICFP